MLVKSRRNKNKSNSVEDLKCFRPKSFLVTNIWNCTYVTNLPIQRKEEARTLGPLPDLSVKNIF